MPRPDQSIWNFLNYDPVTGVFTWRASVSSRSVEGASAGTVTERGYVRICVNGFRAYAHQLAWFWSTGKWPGEIDHKNLDRGDNRIGNLRLADRAQNTANRKGPARDLPKGVIRRDGGFEARVYFRRKRYRLGFFKTPEEAGEAYRRGAELHHGEFARFE